MATCKTSRTFHFNRWMITSRSAAKINIGASLICNRLSLFAKSKVTRKFIRCSSIRTVCWWRLGTKIGRWAFGTLERKKCLLLFRTTISKELFSTKFASARKATSLRLRGKVPTWSKCTTCGKASPRSKSCFQPTKSKTAFLTFSLTNMGTTWWFHNPTKLDCILVSNGKTIKLSSNSTTKWQIANLATPTSSWL